MMGMAFPAVLADAGSSAGVLTYFADSNLAGQGIVVLLGVLSMWAWTIIFTKMGELRRLRRANTLHAEKFRALANVLKHPPDFFQGAGSPLLQLSARAVEA